MDYITAVLKCTKSLPCHSPAAHVEGRSSSGHQQRIQMLSSCVAYPSLTLVFLGQDKDQNAPLSPGTTSCSTLT